MKYVLLFLCMAGSLALIACLSMEPEKSAGAEKKARAFLDSHVRLVEPRFKAMNLADWNANASGEKKYYDEKAAGELEIRRIYSSRDEFAQVKAWLNNGEIKDPLLLRQLTLLHNSYLTNQFDAELMRQIVQKSADIAARFNNFRPVLDGRETDDNQIQQILKESTDNKTRQAAWEASKEIGRQVAPSVVEVVRLRNQAARQLGFSNFYEMSLIANEQTVGEVSAIFDELKVLTDEPFRRLKAEVDRTLSGKYGIRPEEMRPWHYQDRFFQEPPQIDEVDLDQYYRGRKVDDLGKTFYAGIGLPVEDILLRSDIYGRKGKYQHAFATDIDRLGDVRTMLSITDNYYWMGTMLHELGHCVYSKNVRRDLPFLLRSEAHTFLTEAVAMLMERQASNADWIQALAGIREADKEKIRSAGRENLRRKALVFCRWEQVMMRFEKALYENPEQDLNRLWWNLVKEYQSVTPPEGRNQPDWAAKIHLVQYPAYYHNYQLGELAACQLQQTIASEVLKLDKAQDVCFAGRKEVGEYLRSRVFAPGASLRWDELMKTATGQPLSARFFAAEYVH